MAPHWVDAPPACSTAPQPGRSGQENTSQTRPPVHRPSPPAHPSQHPPESQAPPTHPRTHTSTPTSPPTHRVEAPEVRELVQLLLGPDVDMPPKDVDPPADDGGSVEGARGGAQRRALWGEPGLLLALQDVQVVQGLLANVDAAVYDRELLLPAVPGVHSHRDVPAPRAACRHDEQVRWAPRRPLGGVAVRAVAARRPACSRCPQGGIRTDGSGWRLAGGQCLLTSEPITAQVQADERAVGGRAGGRAGGQAGLPTSAGPGLRPPPSARARSPGPSYSAVMNDLSKLPALG